MNVIFLLSQSRIWTCLHTRLAQPNTWIFLSSDLHTQYHAFGTPPLPIIFLLHSCLYSSTRQSIYPTPVHPSVRLYRPKLSHPFPVTHESLFLSYQTSFVNKPAYKLTICSVILLPPSFISHTRYTYPTLRHPNISTHPHIQLTTSARSTQWPLSSPGRSKTPRWQNTRRSSDGAGARGH